MPAYLTGDFLVVALGADLDPGATPGLLEWGSTSFIPKPPPSR